MLSDTEHLKQKQYLAEENFNDEAYLSAINTQRLIQELRNLPIELEMQNDELRRTKGEFESVLVKYRTIFNLAPLGYMTCDSRGVIHETNKTMCDMLGLEEKQLVSKSLSRFSAIGHQNTYNLYIQELLKHDDKRKCDLKLLRSDGATITIHIVSAKVFDEDGTVLIRSAVIDNSELSLHNKDKKDLAKELTLANIEKEKRANELGLANIELEHRAHYDMLTGLPNRSLLAGRLSQAMLKCRCNQQSLAVAYMDLDGFKAVNDTHGHDAGDKLLITLSKRMKEALREGDTLALIDGDEFIVVMGNLDNNKDKHTVLRRLLKTVTEPVYVGDAVIQISVSIGVTLYPQDDVDADQLMRHADHAMYVAKQAGKNRYNLFDIAQDNEINLQLESISDISLALKKQEFVLHYQPKVNMRTSEVIDVEALIRWQHPDRGLVPPLEFLPAIDSHNVSLELGEWVIDTALNQISQWQNKAVDLSISVNISAYQLKQANFTARLAALLAAHPDVNQRYLELEVLETSSLYDISQVSETMKECQELGIRFALDDFGTGYSSLTHLRRLPVYLIKVDQSFVRDMLEDADDLSIVKGVVSLAKAFQREVIAEGVETIAHGAALLQLGCELAQGYGIAHPMPAGDIPEWILSWKADDSWKIASFV
jgi:diguanylate cyclase (GGDEF)-like protein/PAS domain S-box-containing protein